MSDNEALVRELELAKKAREGRSLLMTWVRENYELLTEARRKDRLSLATLAEIAAKLGIKDSWGNPPSVMSMWRAFTRVEGERFASDARQKRARDRQPPPDKPFEFRTLRQPPKKRG